jgi:hypothetical protein
MSEALASLPNLTSIELEYDVELPAEYGIHDPDTESEPPLWCLANQVTGLTHLTLKGGRSATGG